MSTQPPERMHANSVDLSCTLTVGWRRVQLRQRNLHKNLVDADQAHEHPLSLVARTEPHNGIV